MEGDDIVYLNGSFLPKRAAAMPVEDRGTLFGDGIYEVVAYYGGNAFALAPHLRRMRESLDAIRLAPPAEFERLAEITDEILRRNGWRNAKAYWQITRGAAPRDPAFPRDTPPTVLAMAYPLPPLDAAAPIKMLRAVTTPDVRWGRCGIKSIMLLPNLLAHNAALDAGADTAIFIRDGVVAEGTSSNCFVVQRGELWTHPLDGRILGGITRQVLLRLAAELGVTIREDYPPADALLHAEEVFLASTTAHVHAVVAVDGRVIGDGAPGPVTRRLHDALLARIARDCALA